MKRLFGLAAVAVLAFSAPAWADGNAEEGASVFKKCMSCHKISADMKPMTGPNLFGVVGRKVAGVEGYAYSPKMKELAGTNPVWTEDLLDKYLENPKTIVPAGKMAFVGLPKPEDRKNVIAYLKAQSK